MKQSIFKPMCFILIAMFAASSMFAVNAEARRGDGYVARGAGGGAMKGAAIGSLSGGSAGKGAAWGAGIGAVRGAHQREQDAQAAHIRELEQREAYEKGRRDGQRVNYRDNDTRRHVDGAAY